AILASIQRRYSIPFGSDRHGRPLRGSLAMTTARRVEGRHPPVICSRAAKILSLRAAQRRGNLSPHPAALFHPLRLRSPRSPLEGFPRDDNRTSGGGAAPAGHLQPRSEDSVIASRAAAWQS
ncbi:MAG: hypothetical protein ACYCYC_08445, partial [Bellilinea sp.]